MVSHSSKERAQSATAYLLISVVILIALIPLLYFSLQSISNVGETQLTDSVKILQTNINSLGQLSEGARIRVLVHVPKNIASSSVEGTTFWFLTENGERYSAQLDIPAAGSLPLQEGSHYIDLYHNGTNIIIYQCGNGVIEASEQCEENNVPYCKTPSLGCAAPGEVGACNCRCSLSEHCFTKRCVIPSGQASGYCAPCSDDSECETGYFCSAGKCISKTPPITPLEFILDITPPEASVQRGSSTPAIFQVKASWRGGVPEPVTFAVLGLPPTLTAVFLPTNKCTPNPGSSCTVTLQLQAQATAALGTIEYAVEGAASAQTQVAEFNLTVEQQTTPFCKFPYNFKIHPQGNPVKRREGSLNPPLIGTDPFVLWDQEFSRFQMWRTYYQWYGSFGELGIAYAESSDGVDWVDSQTVLRPVSSTWEAKLETNTVLKLLNGDYIMVYMGYPGLIKGATNNQQVFPPPIRRKHLGIATSNDGKFWQRPATNPFLAPTAPWEEPWWNPNGAPEPGIDGGLEEPALIWDTTSNPPHYKLWYAASGYMNGVSGNWGHRIGEAESTDLLTWNKHPNNPIFRPDVEGTWDDAIVSHTNVIPDPQYGYHLFYNGAQGTSVQSVGHAWSADGITWERNPSNPLIITRNLGNSETFQLPGGPTAVWKDGILYLWVMRSPPGTGNFEGQVTIELYQSTDCLPPVPP